MESRYFVRLTQTAREDLEAIHDYHRETAGVLNADRWEDSLDAAVRRVLVYTPYLQVAEYESNLLKREIRRMVYQREGSSVRYLLFFVITEDTAAPGGVGYVSIFHLRHGSRRPLTKREAQDLRKKLNSEEPLI